MPIYKIVCKCGHEATLTANHEVKYYLCPNCHKTVYEDCIEEE